MIISDLSILEVVSEEKDVVGGAYNFLTTEYNISNIAQGATASATAGGSYNFLSSVGGATAEAENSAVVGQSNN
jgi:5,10-methylene-tetrahydrofolate dehydrogenase/methenyl tetrahydrofolate cyclohydrolase